MKGEAGRKGELRGGDTHNSKARSSELYFCFFTGKAAHHIISASGGGRRAGKIPAPTSSNVVDRKVPSERLFSAFLQATAHLYRALYRCFQLHRCESANASLP